MRTILTATILAVTLAGCLPAPSESGDDPVRPCGGCDVGSCYYIPDRDKYYCMSPCDEAFCEHTDRCHEFHTAGTSGLKTCAVVERADG